jgi:membrane-associated protease RseP (regulator of RpoE activity)
MKRSVMLIAVASLLVSAGVSDAQLRRWRAYNDGYYGAGYVEPAPFYSTSSGPWTSADWYKNATWTSRGAADGIVQAGNYEPATQPASWGLRIDDVVAGSAAKKANLRRGDVIIGVGTARTQSFEDLQKALSGSSGNLEVVFLNAENRKMEKARVTPVDGKIGVAVVPVSMR